MVAMQCPKTKKLGSYRKFGLARRRTHKTLLVDAVLIVTTVGY